MLEERLRPLLKEWDSLRDDALARGLDIDRFIASVEEDLACIEAAGKPDAPERLAELFSEGMVEIIEHHGDTTPETLVRLAIENSDIGWAIGGVREVLAIGPHEVERRNEAEEIIQVRAFRRYRRFEARHPEVSAPNFVWHYASEAEYRKALEHWRRGRQRADRAWTRARNEAISALATPARARPRPMSRRIRGRVRRSRTPRCTRAPDRPRQSDDPPVACPEGGCRGVGRGGRW